MTNSDNLSRQDFAENLAAYRVSYIIMALAQTGVFELLSDRWISSKDLSMSLCSNSLLEPLLNAGVALGVLAKRGDLYSNTDTAKRFLSPESPSYLGGTVKYHLSYNSLWPRLPFLATEKSPNVPRPSDQSMHDPSAYQDFIRGVHEAHSETLDFFCDIVDLRQRTTVLDIGAGSGCYTVALLRRHPRLRAVLQDFEPVLQLTREVIQDPAINARVTFLPGDCRNVSLGSKREAILLSNLLHLLPRADAQTILARAHAALAPNGLLIINEPLLDETRTGPHENAIFNLTVILRSGLMGSLFSREEMLGMLAGTGRFESWTQDIPGNLDLYRRPYTIIQAVKAE